MNRCRYISKFIPSRWNKKDIFWRSRVVDVLGFIGLIFGFIAFLRVNKLIKTLKEKDILEQDYKET